MSSRRRAVRSEDVNAIADVAGASNFVWQWPAPFFESGLARLVELGRVDGAHANAMRWDFDAAISKSSARVVTPTLCDIIARRIEAH